MRHQRLLLVFVAAVSACSAQPLARTPTGSMGVPVEVKPTVALRSARSVAGSAPTTPTETHPLELVAAPAEPPSHQVLEQLLPPEKRSGLLPSGLFNPMPGGQIAGYRIDTGLDIAGSPREVFAIAPGTLDYSEPGHTRWTGPNDTANCIRIRLDQPIAWKGHQITHVWYAHLSGLRWNQKEGSTERIHVDGGVVIGTSGKARGMPHLHLGMLLDGAVEQEWGTYLFEDEIRQVLGSYRNGHRLPP